MNSGIRQPHDLPVAFDHDLGHVCVADGTTADMDLPFFGDTVRELARTAPHARMEPVGRIGSRQAAHPVLQVFHVGRSGSTLLSRGVEALAPVMVLREPEVLTAALRAIHADRLPAPVLGDLVRWFEQFAAERGRGVGVKWPSTMSEFAPKLLDLFPGSTVVGIVRDPVEILRSVATAPPTTGVPIADLVRTLPECERLLGDAGLEPDLGSLTVGVWAVAVDTFARLASDGRLGVIRYDAMMQRWPDAIVDVARAVGGGVAELDAVDRMRQDDQKAIAGMRPPPTGDRVADADRWARAEAERLVDLIRPRLPFIGEKG